MTHLMLHPSLSTHPLLIAERRRARAPRCAVQRARIHPRLHLNRYSPVPLFSFLNSRDSIVARFVNRLCLRRDVATVCPFSATEPGQFVWYDKTRRRACRTWYRRRACGRAARPHTVSRLFGCPSHWQTDTRGAWEIWPSAVECRVGG